ncbi:hypothetical protein L6452_06513 [Arctium lappa]|uniref:Uncharacterized protein n=1 Tax=Arctium lappa TaxID=4217 RepID=A0ACB9EJF0_ARCLA|nr:hypothetical protein L6452_06513 [Arctium lappa]
MTMKTSASYLMKMRKNMRGAKNKYSLSGSSCGFFRRYWSLFFLAELLFFIWPCLASLSKKGFWPRLEPHNSQVLPVASSGDIGRCSSWRSFCSSFGLWGMFLLLNCCLDGFLEYGFYTDVVIED